MIKNDDYKYPLIAKKLEDKIIKGEYKEKEKILPVKNIARKYNVHYQTVNNAINQLEKQNILKRKRNIGVFVKENAREILILRRKKEIKKDFKKILKESEMIGVNIEEELKKAGRVKNIEKDKGSERY